VLTCPAGMASVASRMLSASSAMLGAMATLYGWQRA
jgi:hypothetical protein